MKFRTTVPTQRQAVRRFILLYFVRTCSKRNKSRQHSTFNLKATSLHIILFLIRCKKKKALWHDIFWFDLIWFDLIWFDLILILILILIWFDLIWLYSFVLVLKETSRDTFFFIWFILEDKLVIWFFFCNNACILQKRQWLFIQRYKLVRSFVRSSILS
jgi:hypothetical protein